MEKVIMIIIKTAVIALLWRLPYYLPIKKEEKIKSFCAGFCMAEAISVLCIECTWMYSVVFGEAIGFFILSATVAGSLLLFSLLSGKNGGVLLTAVYMFFSSAESEYDPTSAPIINIAAHTLRMGAAGADEATGKRAVILLFSAFAGGVISLAENQLPAAFGAISCCALLCNGIRNISHSPSCLIGAAAACLLAYF